MFPWVKKKYHNLPDYWGNYEATFDKKLEPPYRYVVLDTETTGFDRYKDRILSIGAVSIVGQEIAVNDIFEVYLIQDFFNPKTVEIHGLLKEGKLQTTTEEDALKAFLEYVGNAIIVAHHAAFDINMINEALNRQNLPRLKNKVLDTGFLFKKSRIRSNLIKQEDNYGLDSIAEKLSITIQDRHTAIGDAFMTAIIFMKLRTTLHKLKKINEERLVKLARRI